MRNTIKYQALTICWAIFILVLCNMPAQSFDSASGFLFDGFDKITHLGLFFVLTVLIFNGLIRQHNHSYFKTTTFILIGIITFAFGGFIEVLQWQFFTSRSADWWDLFADTIGVAMAIFAFILFNNKYIILSSKLNYENI